jgi:hypothetical protein
MCRLSRLLSQPPVAMMPTGVTPDGETVEYSMVTPAALILMGDDDALVAVDAHWTTHLSAN